MFDSGSQVFSACEYPFCYALYHILIHALTCTYILIPFVALDHLFPFTELVSDYPEISILSSYSGLKKCCNILMFWMDCNAVLDSMKTLLSVGGVE
jgi:hypothetical protein